MRKLTAISLCGIFGLISHMAMAGCGASGDSGCSGRSRAAHSSPIIEEVAGSRATILPPPFVKAATFEFSQRSGRANRFNATTDFDAFPSVFRAVADESDTGSGSIPGPGEIITIGTVPAICGRESAWNMNLQVYEGRAGVGGRLQANHSYSIVSDTSTPEEFSKIRINGSNGAGDFVAQSGSVIVESADDTVVVLRLKDLFFAHVGGNGKLDGGGLFVLNGTIHMESSGI